MRHGPADSLAFCQNPPRTVDYAFACKSPVTTWTAVSDTKDVFEGRDRATGALNCTGTRLEKFVHDFIAARDKVMNLDRFDLA